MNKRQKSNHKNTTRSIESFRSYLSGRGFSKCSYHWIAIGIFCLGLSIRLMGLDKSIWLDEYYSLRLIFSQDFLQQLWSYDHPPLYFVLLRLWSLISTREEFLRLLSVVFGIGTVAVIMQWLKQYSRLGSLLAGLYCATLPSMLRYSQEIRHYSLLLFATALSLFFASRLIAKPEKLSGYFGLAFSLTIVIATHTVGIMVLLCVCLYMAVTPLVWSKIRLKRTILAIAGPLCVLILLFLFYISQRCKDLSGIFLSFSSASQYCRDPSSWWIPPISLELILSHAKGVFGINQACWPLYAIQRSLPVLADSIVILSQISAYGLLIIFLIFGNWKRSLPLFATAAFYWLQVIMFSIFAFPIFWHRIILPGMIPFMGFAGLQIASIHIRKLKLFLGMGLILLCLVFTTHWIKEGAGKSIEEWREISQLLKSSHHPNDIIIFFPPYVEGPISYYVDLPSKAILSIPVKSNMNEIDRQISGRITKQRDEADRFAVFLIVRFEMNFQKRPQNPYRLLRYLESKFGQPSFSKNFGILSLLKYELPKSDHRVRLS